MPRPAAISVKPANASRVVWLPVKGSVPPAGGCVVVVGPLA